MEKTLFEVSPTSTWAVHQAVGGWGVSVGGLLDSVSDSETLLEIGLVPSLQTDR